MLLVVAALLFVAPAEAELHRGVPIAGEGLRYWDVVDTTIQARIPDEPGGGYHTLSAGPGKTILIRFGDLRRALGGRRQILSAKLILSHSSPERAPLRAVSRMLAPWGEGPMRTFADIRPMVASPAKDASRGAATWRHRRSGEGGAAWQQVGAVGPADSKMLAGVKGSQGELHFEIDGLAADVQRMLDRPYDNFGWALSFDRNVEFFSSQNRNQRPRLVIQHEPASVNPGPDLAVILIEQDRSSGEATYTAHVKNVGSTVAEPFAAAWTIRERTGSTFDVNVSLKPGEHTTIRTSKPYQPDPKDHRLQTVMLRIEPKGVDTDAANDALLIHEDARGLRLRAEPGADELWAQRQIELFNDTVLAQSRFSFAPEGAFERVRIASFDGASGGSALSLKPGSGERGVMREIALAIGLPDLRFGAEPLLPGSRPPIVPETGLLGGETRFDGPLPAQIMLPPDGSSPPGLDLLALEETDLLSMTAVATANALLGKPIEPAVLAELTQRVPSTVLIKATDAAGGALPGADLSFFEAASSEAAPAFTVRAADSGIAILPKRQAAGENPGPFGTITPGQSPAFLVKTSYRGVTEWSWLHHWQLRDAYHRGNTAAAIMEVRFNLPTMPIDVGTNLALERIVADSSKTSAQRLAPLVDGSEETAIPLPSRAGDWVEIDLGRDRALGEVRLVVPASGFYEQFEIRLYGTAQTAENAPVWVRERSLSKTLQSRGDLGPDGIRSVAYRGRADRMRYIRIINLAHRPAAALAEIRVAPVRQTDGS